MGQTQNGLPIGLQILGKRWRERELLNVAQKVDDVICAFRYPAGY